MNLRFKYKEITYADLVSNMGLTETPIMSAPAPGPQWPFQAFITMGNRCHGDAISPDFLAKVKSVNPGWSTPGNNGYHLINDPWNRPVPWCGIIAGANNRCTNAGIIVYDMQMQYFSIAQQKWILISTLADRLRNWTSSYYTMDYTTTDGSADGIRKTRLNMPAFNVVKEASDRSSEDDLPPTGYKYRILHSGLLAVNTPFDATDIGGIFVSCAMKMVSTDGNPLNSSAIEIMGQVGADYYPEAPPNNQNMGYLTGINSTPAVGSSCFRLIPSDGSEKRLYFVSANINPNTFIQPSSVYVLANGPASQCMSAATLQANIPQLMMF